MLCPKCSSTTRVKDTRDVTRRRECQNDGCGYRFYTEERPVEKLGIRKPSDPLDPYARIAELQRENAALLARVAGNEAPAEKTVEPAECPVAAHFPAARVHTVKAQPAPKPAAQERPAAFFTRESLVPDTIRAGEAMAQKPVWAMNLPPAAEGRMR